MTEAAGPIGYQGILLGIPEPTTRLAATTAGTKEFKKGDGTAAIEPTGKLWLKTGWEVFRHLRISQLTSDAARKSVVVGGPGSIDLGCLRFYYGATALKLVPSYALEGEGVDAKPVGAAALFDWTLAGPMTVVEPVLTVGFEAPVVANGFSLASGSRAPEFDAETWKLELSIDGTNWKEVETAGPSTDLPSARRTEGPVRKFLFAQEAATAAEERADSNAALTRAMEAEAAAMSVAVQETEKKLGSLLERGQGEILLEEVEAGEGGAPVDLEGTLGEAGAGAPVGIQERQVAVVAEDDEEETQIAGLVLGGASGEGEVVGGVLGEAAGGGTEEGGGGDLVAAALGGREGFQTGAGRGQPLRALRFQPLLLAEEGEVLEVGKLVFFAAGVPQSMEGARIVSVGAADLPYGAAGGLLDYGRLGTSWRSPWKKAGRRGEVLITLPGRLGSSLDAFSFLTGSDAAAAPVRWRLLGSSDGKTWRILQSQVSSDATIPTTAWTQTRVYPFAGRQASKIARKNPFQKTLPEAGKTCMDADVLRMVEEALTLGQRPAFFYAPGRTQFDAATNTCRYSQEEDGTEVVATFHTGLDGTTEVEDVMKRGRDSRRGTSSRAKQVAPTPFQSSTSEEEEQEAFPGAPTEVARGYKFYRLRATEEASLRALRLFAGRTELDLLSPELGAKVWDPTGSWGGSVRDIAWTAGGTGKGWVGRTLSIGFKEPVAVDAYSVVIDGAGGPRSWKFEGSTNGVYWEPVAARRT